MMLAIREGNPKHGPTRRDNRSLTFEILLQGAHTHVDLDSPDDRGKSSED